MLPACKIYVDRGGDLNTVSTNQVPKRRWTIPQSAMVSIGRSITKMACKTKCSTRFIVTNYSSGFWIGADCMEALAHLGPTSKSDYETKGGQLSWRKERRNGMYTYYHLLMLGLFILDSPMHQYEFVVEMHQPLTHRTRLTIKIKLNSFPWWTCTFIWKWKYS